MRNLLHNIFFILLLLLITSCKSEYECIDADDFGFPKLTIPAAGNKVFSANSSGYPECSYFSGNNLQLDGSGRLYIVVRNSLNSAVSPWFSNSCIGFDCNNGSLNTRLALKNSCKFINCSDLADSSCNYYNSPSYSLTESNLTNCYQQSGRGCIIEHTSLMFDDSNACLLTRGDGLYGLISTNTSIDVRKDPNLACNYFPAQGNNQYYTFSLSNHSNASSDPASVIVDSASPGCDASLSNENCYAGGYKATIPNQIIGSSTGNLYFKFLDNYYQDNSGQYQLIIKSGVGYNSSGPIKLFLEYINGFLVNFTKNTFQALASEIYPTVNALLILFITVSGFMFTMGIIEMKQKEFFVFILKIALLLELVTDPDSWNFFNEHLFELFLGGVDQINCMLINTVSTGACNSGSGSLSFFDKFIDILYSNESQLKLVSLIGVSSGGFITFLLVEIGLFISLMFILFALFTYVIGSVGVAITIVLFPLFLPFILFKTTQDKFDTILKSLTTGAMQAIFVIAFLALSGQIVVNQYQNLIGFKICLQPFLPLQKYIPEELNIQDVIKVWKPVKIKKYQTHTDRNAYSLINVPEYLVNANGQIIESNGVTCAPYVCRCYRNPQLPFLQPDTRILSNLGLIGTPCDNNALGYNDQARIDYLVSTSDFGNPFGALAFLLIAFIMHKFSKRVPSIAQAISGGYSQQNYNSYKAFKNARDLATKGLLSVTPIPKMYKSFKKYLSRNFNFAEKFEKFKHYATPDSIKMLQRLDTKFFGKIHDIHDKKALDMYIDYKKSTNSSAYRDIAHDSLSILDNGFGYLGRKFGEKTGIKLDSLKSLKLANFFDAVVPKDPIDAFGSVANLSQTLKDHVFYKTTFGILGRDAFSLIDPENPEQGNHLDYVLDLLHKSTGLEAQRMKNRLKMLGIDEKNKGMFDFGIIENLRNKGLTGTLRDYVDQSFDQLRKKNVEKLINLQKGGIIESNKITSEINKLKDFSTKLTIQLSRGDNVILPAYKLKELLSQHNNSKDLDLALRSLSGDKDVRINLSSKSRQDAIQATNNLTNYMNNVFSPDSKTHYDTLGLKADASEVKIIEKIREFRDKQIKQIEQKLEKKKELEEKKVELINKADERSELRNKQKKEIADLSKQKYLTEKERKKYQNELDNLLKQNSEKNNAEIEHKKLQLQNLLEKEKHLNDQIEALEISRKRQKEVTSEIKKELKKDLTEINNNISNLQKEIDQVKEETQKLDFMERTLTDPEARMEYNKSVAHILLSNKEENFENPENVNNIPPVHENMLKNINKLLETNFSGSVYIPVHDNNVDGEGKKQFFELKASDMKQIIESEDFKKLQDPSDIKQYLSDKMEEMVAQKKAYKHNYTDNSFTKYGVDLEGVTNYGNKFFKQAVLGESSEEDFIPNSAVNDMLKYKWAKRFVLSSLTCPLLSVPIAIASVIDIRKNRLDALRSKDLDK